MNWLWTLLINIVTLYLTAWILPGFHINGIWPALITTLVISVLNVLIKPILTLLSLPVNFLTLGLFSFIITGFIIWLTSTIVKGFNVDGFWWAVLAGIVMALINAFLNWILPINN